MGTVPVDTLFALILLGLRQQCVSGDCPHSVKKKSTFNTERFLMCAVSLIILTSTSENRENDKARCGPLVFRCG